MGEMLEVKRSLYVPALDNSTLPNLRRRAKESVRGDLGLGVDERALGRGVHGSGTCG